MIYNNTLIKDFIQVFEFRIRLELIVVVIKKSELEPTGQFYNFTTFFTKSIIRSIRVAKFDKFDREKPRVTCL